MAALAVAAFCYGTTENLPVGLLQLIAADLHESVICWSGYLPGRSSTG